MTDRYLLRPIEPGEFGAFAEVPVQAFNDATCPPEAIEHERLTFEFDRSLAAVDGGVIAGTAAAYSFRLTVPGGTVDAAGVTFVSVRPSHRRRGILSAMMRHQLTDIAGRGEPVAALYASESGIYSRYGYGCASGQLRLTLRRGEGALVPAADMLLPAAGMLLPAARRAAQPAALPGGRDPAAAPAGGRGPVCLRHGAPGELRAGLAAVYDRVLPQRPGMIARDDRWWDSQLDDAEYFRHGMSPLRCLLAEDESGPRGYALYRTRPDWTDEGLPSGTLAVSELIAADAGATAALWADLLSRDLIGEVVARQRPVDDPLLDMLADRRRARARLTDGLWVRLTDVPGALRQRRYSCAADVVLDVTDELLPANSGRWRLECPGPGDTGAARCERTAKAADIALPVAALGAGYLGGTRLGALAAAGLVTEHTPGTLTRLSAALYSDPAPWCPSMF